MGAEKNDKSLPRQFFLDAKDYHPSWPKHRRIAARAIVIKERKLLMIHSKKYGEYKLPGGGVIAGEEITDALMRETREEAGVQIVPASVWLWGLYCEKRKDAVDDKIFEHISYCYRCEIEDGTYPLELDNYEKEYRYQAEWVDIDIALQTNSELAKVKVCSWAEREFVLLQALKKEIES